MKLQTSSIVLILFCIAFIFLLADSSFAQCSMCRKIATDGANSKVAGNVLNYGILYLLALPYCMILLIFRKQIFDFVRAMRKK